MTLTAFHGPSRLASGPLADVVAALLGLGPQPEGLLVFDDHTGRVIDIDLRGSLDDIIARHSAAANSLSEDQRPRGRPRMGVASREVTLLPRHWQWLATQPGGASATLRKLIDTAQGATPTAAQNQRKARDAAYHFLHAIAGDFPGYEAAQRSLYAGDQSGFAANMAQWPKDIASHALTLAAAGIE